MTTQDSSIDLIAVIVSMAGDEPQILLTPGGRLPSGPFETGHRTLQQGLRSWVAERTHQSLGWIEQLYTFADRDRAPDGHRTISIGYLALMREAAAADGTAWVPWRRHFPWEDRRQEPHKALANTILPVLHHWIEQTADCELKRNRLQRVLVCFPEDRKRWNEELVLQRYELLWEAGLLCESPGYADGTPLPGLGEPLAGDHRRILATGIARLRAKIKYRPVVFELMPEAFTLSALQRTVEGLSGLSLHTQNFRRLVDSQGLVDETGMVTSETGGRPAKLYAFRPDVLMERAAAGTKLPRAGQA